jgi:hypothetical protein
MTIRLQNVLIEPDQQESALLECAAERLGVPAEGITHLQIARRAIDARGGNVHFVMALDVALVSSDAEMDAVSAGRAVAVPQIEEVRPTPGEEPVKGRVVVVGCGPAGLFAAWRLAEHGYRPLILERGAPVEERHGDVGRFVSTRTLDPDSNFLFGAGGAGAYSDGKLYTRIRDPRARLVLERLIAFGAPARIAVDGRPHIGTDLLCDVVGAMCKALAERGAEFRWRTKLTGLEVEDGRLQAVRAASERIETNCLVLATGANSRDSFRLLHDAGLRMEPKPFQMGLRIEHPRELIDKAVYGRWAGHPNLGAADYVLSSGGVTSFCVCPGGALIAACCEPETVCTNGMSNSKRDGAFSNGALVATVHPEEYGPGPLAGLDFQKRWEREAFLAAGGDYTVPAQRASDFLAGRLQSLGRRTTYPFGERPVKLQDIVPQEVALAIARALIGFNRRIRGFSGDAAILVGPETRASCPVRIVRDAGRLTSLSVDGVYPVGEGSGYASGIMSSAVDGLRAAEAAIRRFAPCRGA